MDFSEAFEACDLKVGRYRQLIVFMKVYEYRRSRSFLDLGPRSIHTKNQTKFSQKPLCHSEPNFV